jgi:lipid-A-disaccharide synthase
MTTAMSGPGTARIAVPETVELLLVAGEASGDLHGAPLVAELRRLVGGLEVFGLGGDGLVAAGLKRVADSAEISVVGLSEVFRVLPRAREIFDLILAEVDRRRPRLAVLIDFPEFNLRLARALRERGVRVVYYISPQVWAWRRGRVKAIAEHVDTMLVLFPFEVDFYRRHGVEAVHVGHPLVDEIPELPQIWDRGEAVDEPYQVALLPGSRTSEVEVLLPVMLETVRRLAGEIPVFARMIRAPTIPHALLEEAVDLAGLPVRIVPAADRAEAIATSHFALCASGTATLEVGLLGTPMAVLYRLGSWTYLMGKLLVRLPYVSLVNLVLGRQVVPELLQGRATPERVSDLVLSLLQDRPAIDAMRSGLGELRGRLGESGASRRAAREIAARLGVEAAG